MGEENEKDSGKKEEGKKNEKFPKQPKSDSQLNDSRGQYKYRLESVTQLKKIIDQISNSTASLVEPDEYSRKEMSKYASTDNSVLAVKGYGRHYKARASRLSNAKNSCVVVMGIIVVLMICFFSNYGNYFLRDWVLLGLLSDENTPNTRIPAEYMILSFYICKMLIFALLVALFVWVSRIFSQLRRLEITYLDKAIISELYSEIMHKAVDSEIEVVRPYALSYIFAPILLHSEVNSDQDGVFGHLNLATAIESIKSKSKES